MRGVFLGALFREYRCGLLLFQRTGLPCSSRSFLVIVQYYKNCALLIIKHPFANYLFNTRSFFLHCVFNIFTTV